MRETLGEKLKRLFGGKKGSDAAVKTSQLQPDILDVALQDQLTHTEAASDKPIQKEPIDLHDISEEGPKFSSEDLAQMSEGSWKPEGEPAIEDLYVDVPEMETVPEAAEATPVNPLLESMEEDAAVIEDLTSQMENMPFFTSEDEEPEGQSTEPEEIIEETPEEGISELTESVIETAETANEELPEEDIEPGVSEDETAEAEETEEDFREEVKTAETEEAQEELSEEQASEENETEETEGGSEETEEVSEMEDESAEIDETPEDSFDETAECKTEESSEEDASAGSAVAEELSDLWGLNRTQEEIDREETQDWLKRHIVRAAVWLILFGIISSGAYAYEQGWRINLFYEVQHTSESSSTDGRKKRPDSSEFVDKKEDEPVQASEDEQEAGRKTFGEKFESWLSDLIVEFEDIDPDDLNVEPVPEITIDPPAPNVSNEGSPVTQNEETNSGDDVEKEFVGITVSNEKDPEKISEEGPTGTLESPDQVTVEETGPVQTVEVERAVNYYLSADGSVREIRVLPGEIKTVDDLLKKANVSLADDDIVEPSLTDPLSEGDTVKITRILYKTVTETESIPGEAVEKLTPVLRSGRTYAINQDNQADGEREVTYKEKYVNGELESREEISSVVTKEPTDYILLVGANVPASPINGAQYTDIQILGNAPAEYSAVYSGRCTAYNFKKGAYGASGMYLSQGMVAVDPSLIPYGSLLYITNGDGSFVYGWAIACDYCEASAAGDAVVDLFFDTYRECTFFGARSLNVYVVKQLTQSELSGYVAKEGMFRSRVPA